MIVELTANKYKKLYNKIIKNTFKEGYDVSDFQKYKTN